MIDQITHVFRLSLYLLLGLSSVTIGLAEGHLYPHLLTIPLIALAFWYLDENPPLKIDSAFTSLFGIIALLIAMWEFQQGRVNVEMRILSASHLLAYFTWIVLVLEKQSQQYWWLLALAILNMAVAASLTTSAALGLSVLIFLFLAVWTLAIFTAYRGTVHIRDSRSTSTVKNSAVKNKKSAETPARPVKPQMTAPVVAKAIPLVSQVRGGFHFDPSDNWLGYRLIASVGYITIASVAVGLAIFMITPRIWIGNWTLPSGQDEAYALPTFGKSVSGFTSDVQLGDMGEILSNPTPVLYTKFLDYNSDKPLTNTDVMRRLQTDDLLFRGAVLTNYGNGRWFQGDSLLNSNPMKRSPIGDMSNSIRFLYELEPVGRDLLFMQMPVSGAKILSESFESKTLEQHPLSQVVSVTQRRSRSAEINTIKYEATTIPPTEKPESGFPEYELATGSFYTQILQSISRSLESSYQAGETDLHRACTRFALNSNDREILKKVSALDTYIRGLLNLNREQLPGLIELTDRICAPVDDEPLTPAERVQKLHYFLRDSGEYSYTLDLTVTNPNLDPVEDFLLVRKSGHCEYFASAMTLMLRAAGIPSRMVTGFRTGRWVEDTKTLVIEQRHAHAWVEAFVNGKWLIIDPTTYYDEEENYQVQYSAYSWTAIRAELVGFWQNYVLGVSLAGQQQRFYDPIRKTTTGAYNAIMQSGEEYQNKILPESGTRYSLYNRFLMFIATVFPILIIVLVVAFLLFRQRLRNFLDWLLPKRRSARRRQMMVFFRKFLEVSAKHGLRKKPEQTALEFARIFQQKFHSQLINTPLDQLPLAVTQAYYQARFRGDPLTEEEIINWETKIQSLHQRLSTSH